jgi:hypothetical protein
MGPGNAVDLVEATSGWRRAEFTGRSTSGAIRDHAGGARAAFQAAGAWPPPGWLCVTVHARGVRVGVAIAVAQVSKAGRGLAAVVVAAAATCESVTSVSMVPVACRLHLSDELGQVAAVVDTVDLLMAS